MTNKNNKAIIFCAPSGAGKSTLARAMLEAFPFFSFSISATTRARRGSEQNGKEYYFLDIDDFKRNIAEDAFVEWEEVYTDTFYGTLKEEVARIHAEGGVPVFDVDVKGAVSLKHYFGDAALVIFVYAPKEMIKDRLRGRGTEGEEKIAMRLARLPEEMTYKDKADVVIENIDLQKAIEDTKHAIQKFLND